MKSPQKASPIATKVYRHEGQFSQATDSNRMRFFARMENTISFKWVDKYRRQPVEAFCGSIRSRSDKNVLATDLHYIGRQDPISKRSAQNRDRTIRSFLLPLPVERIAGCRKQFLWNEMCNNIVNTNRQINLWSTNL
jgi:hypothetical protein